MNGTELNTIRRSLWLSRADAAVLFGVGERTLRHWESGDWAVPEDVRNKMIQLDAALTVMANDALAEYIGRTAADVVLIRYAAPEDMPDEHRTMPLDCHAAGIGRARIRLIDEGANVRIVMFRPAEFFTWIDEHALPDSAASRAAWAARVPEAPPRANKTE